jgi:hypothetical protein
MTEQQFEQKELLRLISGHLRLPKLDTTMKKIEE